MDYRILVIDRAVPTPDWSGASARLLNILESMIKLGFEVDLIVRDSHEMKRIPEVLHSIGIHNVSNIHASSNKFNSIVKNASLVWLSFFDIAEEYLPVIRKISKIPIIIDTVDVHSLRLIRQASITQDNSVLSYALDVKRRERKIYSQADMLIGVTKPDCIELSKLAPDVPNQIISNIYKPFIPGDSDYGKRNGILFIGNATHPPNMDALKLLSEIIFPKILELLPDVRLTIIGNETDKLPFKLSKNIIALGRIENVLPIIKNSLCSLAPIRYGAGIKGKVVESMFYGTPVVATKIALEGMEVNHLDNVMIAHNWDEFVKHIYTLHSDEMIWNHLRKNGIVSTRKKFGIEVCQKTLKNIFITLGLKMKK